MRYFQKACLPQFHTRRIVVHFENHRVENFFRAQDVNAQEINVQIGEEDATPVLEGDILCVPYNTIAGFLEGDKHGEGGAPRARGVLL